VEHLPNAQTDSVKEGRRLITRSGDLLNDTTSPLSSVAEIGPAKTTKEKTIKNKATPLAKKRRRVEGLNIFYVYSLSRLESIFTTDVN
jgi:hypothetical protein